MIDDTVRRSRLEHEVTLPAAKLNKYSSVEETEWCREQWGERWCPITNPEGLWACFWTGKHDPITYHHCFAYEQDMVLFLLRWA